MLKQTQPRIAAKVFTYKIPATIFNWVFTYIVTGSADTATSLMLLGWASTLIINFANEWIWEYIPLGANGADSQTRSILKTVTFKVASILATTVTNYWYVGSWSLAGAMSITKQGIGSLIFYVNERIWNRFNWGRFEETKKEEKLI
jgi:uncharacterized membrane protein